MNTAIAYYVFLRGNNGKITMYAMWKVPEHHQSQSNGTGLGLAVTSVRIQS